MRSVILLRRMANFIMLSRKIYSKQKASTNTATKLRAKSPT